MNKETFDTENPWGMSTSVDLYDCDPSTIRDADKIKEYVKQLCDLIEMRTFGECLVVHFGDDPKVSGFSMTQLIETSLVSGHFANNTNDVEKMVQFSKDFFGAKAVIHKVSKRS
jgi:S-adenosylmethionine decarboxylase